MGRYLLLVLRSSGPAVWSMPVNHTHALMPYYRPPREKKENQHPRESSEGFYRFSYSIFIVMLFLFLRNLTTLRGPFLVTYPTFCPYPQMAYIMVNTIPCKPTFNLFLGKLMAWKGQPQFLNCPQKMVFLL